MATVTVIPAKPRQELKGLEATAKLRVCAYCRVSTENEEQLSSYVAQVTHYTDYIKRNPEWDSARIYADEGISGTNTKKRVEFNRMIEDCMAGKIDMVITKSISRFARNTLDTLQYVRQLKEKNIAIFFEKENVNTLDSKGEFLITLLGSLAQEESSNISQITRMGIAYRFQEGKVIVNHNRFLGYAKDENGNLVIVLEEAEIIKRIYREFLEGKSDLKIAKGLEHDGILTGAGKATWWASTIKSILKNEKYMGDALLQKTHTVDFLTKKRVKNNGIVQQYYVEDSHPAIINKEEFAAVQNEFERRSSMRGYSQTGKSAYTSEYAFSGKIFCQNCGSKFRRASWGTGKNKQYVWRCINREQNGVDKCSAKTVKEKALEQAFLRVLNKAQKSNLVKFDEDLFRRLVEKVKVQSMVEAVFVFKTGVEVREIL